MTFSMRNRKTHKSHKDLECVDNNIILSEFCEGPYCYNRSYKYIDSFIYQKLPSEQSCSEHRLPYLDSHVNSIIRTYVPGKTFLSTVPAQICLT